MPCKKLLFRRIARGNAMLALGSLLIALLIAHPLHADAVELPAGPDRAVFWSVHDQGGFKGYLLGTVHSEDPRVLEFSSEFLEKLRSSKVFAMELVPDLPTMARLTEYMRLEQGQTLEDLVGAKRFSALLAALSEYGIPKDFVARMKPWAAMMTLSTPPAKTGFFMDFSLSLRASGNGAQVVGLETLEQQLAFLENMPMDMQLDLLDQALAESGRVRALHGQLLEIYLQNDLPGLQNISDEQLLTSGAAVSTYFYDQGIRARNQRMFESLLPYLEDGAVFIAVGALHLPGDTGLLNLLRRHGYRLVAQEMPFAGQHGSDAE